MGCFCLGLFCARAKKKNLLLGVKRRSERKEIIRRDLLKRKETNKRKGAAPVKSAFVWVSTFKLRRSHMRGVLEKSSHVWVSTFGKLGSHMRVALSSKKIAYGGLGPEVGSRLASATRLSHYRINVTRHLRLHNASKIP